MDRVAELFETCAGSPNDLVMIGRQRPFALKRSEQGLVIGVGGGECVSTRDVIKDLLTPTVSFDVVPTDPSTR
ncbi:hypothetical protein TPCU411_18690 [Cutibacterium acnes]|nr:hypothetical protein TPCU411_18690 [Cutibacterium acnes]